MTKLINFYEFALEHANEVFNVQVEPFDCPLTGELITDCTVKEMALLEMLKIAKEGDATAIEKLYDWHGLTKENIAGIVSLKGLRFFK